jgi:hypothetical protein
MYCAMRGHFLRDMNAISTCRSLSPFARYSKTRNGGGITFGTIPDTPYPRKSNDGRCRILITDHYGLRGRVSLCPDGFTVAAP